MSDLRSSVIRFCADTGVDPLLVQGAGGNVSWKDGRTLWVKASGTWLADAATGDIFVPVDLAMLQGAIESGNYSVVPAPVHDTGLKPSIETLLHALMPHTVVVHLHAVEILAHLVRRDCEHELSRLIGGRVSWEIVDYFRPGADLAMAVKRALDRNRAVKVVFLKSHGVVIGGADVSEVRGTLGLLLQLLRQPFAGEPRSELSAGASGHLPAIGGYAPVEDGEMHRMATDARLFGRLDSDWALYPDHVVFLGARAHRYDSLDELRAALARTGAVPDLVFVKDVGVFVTAAFSKSQSAQLRCYFDVLVRQPEGAKLDPLPDAQVADLLGREDEKHRMRLSSRDAGAVSPG